MPPDPKLDLLRSVPLFARLNKNQLARVAQLADEIEVSAERVLMRQGEPGAEMFIVLAGRVRVERDGRPLGEHGPGSWLGEMALLSEGHRTATVTTTEQTRLLVLAHREFHALMDEMPEVRLSVYECLADRIRGLESSAAH